MRRRAYGELSATHLGAAKGKAERACALRRQSTPAERVLWTGLRRRALGGLRFRRQQPIAGFIVDFYCPSLKLAIEVDGLVHDDRRDLDLLRDRALRRLGVVVLRVRNDEVMQDCHTVCSRVFRLAATLVARHPPPKPGEGRGGG
jgi:very-short-patch-repair endonuclease